MTDLITSALVRLDEDLGAEKHDVIRSLAAIVASAGRATDADQLAADAITREGTAATGLPGGIAIPHCRTTAVNEPTLAFARLSPPVEFGAKDGPADLAFLIAAPAGGDATHLQLLTKLASEHSTDWSASEVPQMSWAAASRCLPMSATMSSSRKQWCDFSAKLQAADPLP